MSVSPSIAFCGINQQRQNYSLRKRLSQPAEPLAQLFVVSALPDDQNSQTYPHPSQPRECGHAVRKIPAFEYLQTLRKTQTNSHTADAVIAINSASQSNDRA